MAFGDFKGLPITTASNKMLHNKEFKSKISWISAWACVNGL